jgi:antitoxin (DNA-binding transcriptional repressor) of toxin-antitoxin stability system
MKSIDLSEVSALVPLVTPGSQELVILTRDGQTVAAIVPTNEHDVESLLLSINPQFQAILERSQQRLESDGGVSTAEVRKRLGLPAAGN